MDHIAQLKQIRADAIHRLRNSADFKLAGKLGALIHELGESVDDRLDYDGPSENRATTKPPFSLPKAGASAKDEDGEDDLVDELVAEMKEDDNLVGGETKVIGPFITPESRGKGTNGATPKI